MRRPTGRPADAAPPGRSRSGARGSLGIPGFGHDARSTASCLYRPFLPRRGRSVTHNLPSEWSGWVGLLFTTTSGPTRRGASASALPPVRILPGKAAAVLANSTRLVTSSRQRRARRGTQAGSLHTRSHARRRLSFPSSYYYLKSRVESIRVEPSRALRQSPPGARSLSRQSGLMWPKCGFPSGTLLPTYGSSVPTLLHGSSRVEVFPLLPAVAQFTLAEAEPRPALETVRGEGESQT